jgi:hypothetical protein
MMLPNVDQIREQAYRRWEQRDREHSYDQADWHAAECDLVLRLNYEPIMVLPIGGPPQFCTGDYEDRQCRYCRKKKPEVQFRNTAHALPECIGNTAIIANDECDTCNDFFSRTLEDSLGKAFLPARVMVGLEGKEGVPSYRYKNSESRIDANNSTGGIHFSVNDEVPIIEEDEAEQILRMSIPAQPYIPIRVLKCLSKMALAIMPEEELPNFTHTIHWILEPDDTKDLERFRGDGCYIYFYRGAFVRPHAVLLRRKTTDTPLPYMLFLLHTGFFGVGSHVSLTPCNDMFAGQRMNIPRVGTIIVPGRGESSSRHVRLDSVEKRKEHTMDFEFRYVHREIRDKTPEETEQAPGPITKG